MMVNEEEIHRELSLAQQLLAAAPKPGWTALEEVARYLHWLRDATAPDYFRQAAACYPFRDRGQDRLRLGNLYRLAGDGAKASEYFAQATHLLQPAIAKQDPITLQFLVESLFLQDRYEEGEQAAQVLRALRAKGGDRTPSRSLTVTQLARARRLKDSGLAKEAAEQFAAIIREENIPVGYVGGPTPWDWYELALQPMT
ncbi:MAG: hypothetical protein H0T73_20165 [Ardenticatenales bacterium]|nr:hypothetical protein [Ardenticatenales bacterium]